MRQGSHILKKRLASHQDLAHSIGLSGKWIVSYGEGRSALDLALIHEKQSQDLP
jgi:hypothetical protein